MQKISNLELVKAGQRNRSSGATPVMAICHVLAEFLQAWVANVTASALVTGGRS